MTQHNHRGHVEGCFHCESSKDEVDVTGEGDMAPARCHCGRHMPCRRHA